MLDDGSDSGDKCKYNGKVYNTGDIFPDKDGCNTCSCNPDGEKGVGCTTKGCSDNDTCMYNGKVYQTGDVFCAEDGCNTCSCNPEGTEGVGCSIKDCTDMNVLIPDLCK